MVAILDEKDCGGLGRVNLTPKEGIAAESCELNYPTVFFEKGLKIATLARVLLFSTYF